MFLRAFAYAKFFGVYGFIVFVLSNVPLLVLSPSSGRLVSESWRYVVLSGGVSLGIVAFTLVVYRLGSIYLLGRLLSVTGTHKKTVFEYVDVVSLSIVVVLGAWLTTVLIAYASIDALGIVVVLVPVVLKIADTVLSLVVPLSGSVDVANESYTVNSSGRSYDLSTATLIGAVNGKNTTAFCIRGDDGIPHILVLPTELYERIYRR